MTLRKEILALALPAIATNITTPLLGIADMAITGHIGDAVYMAAIAVGGTVFNVLYWLFNFLRMGTCGLSAQACGRGEDGGDILARSLATAAAIGIALIAAGGLLGPTVIDFMDADRATPYALEYFSICIWGAPAVMATYSAMGWLVGMQDTRATMYVAIATNLVNLAVSATLVYGLGRTIDGVASGTLVAQWAGAFLALAIIARRFHPRIPEARVILQTRLLVRFFSINADIFLRTACLVAVTLWFTHSGASAGVDVLAANALLLQLFMLFSFFMDGFAYAAEALSGKYHSNGPADGVKRLERALVRIGLGFAVVFGLLYAGFGKWICSLLTDRPEIVEVATMYLPWAVAMPLCGFMAFVYDGILVGLTRTRIMLVAMALAAAVFFSIWALSKTSLANHGLWLAFDSYLLVRGLAEWLMLRSGAEHRLRG